MHGGLVARDPPIAGGGRARRRGLASPPPAAVDGSVMDAALEGCEWCRGTETGSASAGVAPGGVNGGDEMSPASYGKYWCKLLGWCLPEWIASRCARASFVAMFDAAWQFQSLCVLRFASEFVFVLTKACC